MVFSRVVVVAMAAGEAEVGLAGAEAVASIAALLTTKLAHARSVSCRVRRRHHACVLFKTASKRYQCAS